MKEIAKITISLIDDRGIKKWKVVGMKEGKFFGFIKPI